MQNLKKSQIQLKKVFTKKQMKLELNLKESTLSLVSDSKNSTTTISKNCLSRWSFPKELLVSHLEWCARMLILTTKQRKFFQTDWTQLWIWKTDLKQVQQSARTLLKSAEVLRETILKATEVPMKTKTFFETTLLRCSWTNAPKLLFALKLVTACPGKLVCFVRFARKVQPYQLIKATSQSKARASTWWAS